MFPSFQLTYLVCTTFMLGSYLASSAKLASLTQMSAKVHMRSTKEIKSVLVCSRYVQVQ